MYKKHFKKGRKKYIGLGNNNILTIMCDIQYNTINIAKHITKNIVKAQKLRLLAYGKER